MAKKAKSNGDSTLSPQSTPEHADVADVFRNGVVKYGDSFSLRLADIAGNPKAVMYLLQNGYSQSMTDAAAFTKEQKAGKSPDELAAMALDARVKRHDAIENGTIGARGGGPKLPPVERVMREVAEERLKAIAVSRGVAMPKGDTLKAALDKIIQRDPDGIRTEAETRIANARAVASAVGGDDDDLFAPVATSAPATA
jgi:hypothetical protein